jgi:hypothetical protein
MRVSEARALSDAKRWRFGVDGKFAAPPDEVSVGTVQTAHVVERTER